MTKAVARTVHATPERLPLRLVAGQQVQVGERDQEWPAFVFVATWNGTGWVPARHLSATSGPAEVLNPYDTSELPTQIYEVLEVVAEDLESGWMWCRADGGREGWVPLKTLEIADRSR